MLKSATYSPLFVFPLSQKNLQGILTKPSAYRPATFYGVNIAVPTMYHSKKGYMEICFGK
jgi:hypothetical protein